MRKVRTCDFCGDDATGLYEPLPSSIPDGPRMLLCDGCRDRLATVVDPLLAAFEGDAGGPADRTAAEPPDPPAGSGGQEPDPSAAGEPAAQTDGAPESSSPTPPPASVSESRDASGRSQAERAGTPPGYRKVMRFLENRQFPVERAEAEQLAADAYDLEDSTVAAAIDHAVEYGRLREVGGELKR